MMLEFYGTRMKRIRYREDADEKRILIIAHFCHFDEGEITREIRQRLKTYFMEFLV